MPTYAILIIILLISASSYTSGMFNDTNDWWKLVWHLVFIAIGFLIGYLPELVRKLRNRR